MRGQLPAWMKVQMQPRRIVGGILAALLTVGASLACAQRSESPAGPTPAPSRGMPGDLDTTGMSGTQPGCVAPPGGTASATGGDVRTPATARDVRAPRTTDDVGTGHAAETAELPRRGSTTANADGC
jgi:hypothetical protein